MASPSEWDGDLVEASEDGRVDDMYSALNNGANPNGCKRVTLECDIKLPGGGTETRTDTVNGETALGVAILNRKPDSVAVILEAGGDANAPIEWRFPAVVKSWDNAKWNARWPPQFAWKFAPLTLALTARSMAINRKGGSLTFRNPDKPTSRNTLVSPNIEIIRALLQAGASISDTAMALARGLKDKAFYQLLSTHQRGTGIPSTPRSSGANGGRGTPNLSALSVRSPSPASSYGYGIFQQDNYRNFGRRDSQVFSPSRYESGARSYTASVTSGVDREPINEEEEEPVRYGYRPSHLDEVSEPEREREPVKAPEPEPTPAVESEELPDRYSVDAPTVEVHIDANPVPATHNNVPVIEVHPLLEIPKPAPPPVEAPEPVAPVHEPEPEPAPASPVRVAEPEPEPVVLTHNHEPEPKPEVEKPAPPPAVLKTPPSPATKLPEREPEPEPVSAPEPEPEPVKAASPVVVPLVLENHHAEDFQGHEDHHAKTPTATTFEQSHPLPLEDHVSVVEDHVEDHAETPTTPVAKALFTLPDTVPHPAEPHAAIEVTEEFVAEKPHPRAVPPDTEEVAKRIAHGVAAEGPTIE